MLIDRPTYLAKLQSFRDQSDLIKVVTGLRRSGKSTLFELFINQLKAEGVKDSQIIHLNLDDPANTFTDATDLYNYIMERASADEQTYVFLDEVQMVPDFQKAVNGLRIQEHLDIYLTGSNAYLLSGELATLLSGRYIEIHMLPLSFREYLTGLYPDVSDLSSLKRRVNLQAVFSDYLDYGGLPQTLSFYRRAEGVPVPGDMEISEYLENIFSTIVYKDIMDRYSITDRGLLERITKFVLDNVGQPISIKKITDSLNGNRMKVSFHTVEKYLTALEECFLIYRADRYDIRGRELLSTGYKYFVADSGLRNYLLGRQGNQDVGQLLENVVYIELLRRRQRIQVGKYDNLEVDFVTRDREGTTYYQVSKDVSSPQTLARELAPLQGIQDQYPKVILTLDTASPVDHDGVKEVNVIDWLLGEGEK